MSYGDALYQTAIKQYAQAAHGDGLLDACSGEAKLDNPLCGDRIRLQVVVDAGRITALAHQTRGCLLCRAAASAISQRAAGLDEAGVAAAVGSLEDMLQTRAPLPAGWPELSMFVPVQDFPSRHRCVLLPFRALLAALKNSGEKNRDHEP